LAVSIPIVDFERLFLGLKDKYRKQGRLFIWALMLGFVLIFEWLWHSLKQVFYIVMAIVYYFFVSTLGIFWYLRARARCDNT